MDTKKTGIKVKTYFDRLSDSYTNSFNSEIINAILDKCHIREDSVILEAGSGTSDLTPHLLNRIEKNGKVICADISGRMIAKAKKKITDSRVSFAVTDVTTMSFRRLKVTAVICFNMFPHVSDKPAFLKNIYANLATGGELVISHDRNRESVISMHKRHGVTGEISHFPDLNSVISMLEKSRFTISSSGDDKYFFIRAVK